MVHILQKKKKTFVITKMPLFDLSYKECNNFLHLFAIYVISDQNLVISFKILLTEMNLLFHGLLLPIKSHKNICLVGVSF